MKTTTKKTMEKTIDARFNSFHKAHPEVYGLLVRFAKQVRRRGKSQYSMKTLFERTRWHLDIDLQSDEPFELNNSYTSRYARLVMENEPELAGFFKTRKLLTA